MKPKQIEKEFQKLCEWLQTPDAYPQVNEDRDFGVEIGEGFEYGLINFWSDTDSIEIARGKILEIKWERAPTNYGDGDYCHVIVDDGDDREQGYEIRMFKTQAVPRPK